MKKIFLHAQTILKKHTVILSCILGLIFVIQAFALVTPYLFGNLIDSLTITASNKWIYFIFLIAMAIAVRFSLSYTKAIIDIRKYVFEIDMDFEMLAMKNILRFPVGQLRADNTGEIQSVVQKGISSFSEYIKIILFQVLPALAFTIVTLVWLATLSFHMFIVTAVFSIVTICYMYWINVQVKDRFVDTRTKWQKMDSHRMEVIRNASLIIYYDQIKETLKDYKQQYHIAKKMGISDWVTYVTRIHLMKVFHILAIVGILIFGARGVIHGQYTAGEFVIVYSWVSAVFSKTEILMQSFRYIMRFTPSIEKYFELVERPLELVENGTQKSISYGSVSFENVSYKYKTDPGVASLKHPHALKNVSFKLAAGESLAIVGPSGSGKSTLVSLLMRAFNQDSGGIYLDNLPLDSYASSYKRNIGYIEQRPKLFDQSVRNNLLFGVSEKDVVTDNQIFEVLAQVGLKEKIEKLPQGLDSRIGEQGVKFSGGEAQRLSIAGILLKQPKLFILDEATSALDEISQKKIKEAVQFAGKEATSLIVAHRLSTINHCDKILVLDKGEVEFFGTYDDAEKYSPTFKEMIKESKLHKVS